MYNVGDYVVKAADGVCRIVAIKPLDIPNIPKDKLYLHLEPIENPTVKLYIPQDSAEEKLRDVITEEEASQLISEIPEIEPTDISEEKQRDKVYKEALLSGSCQQLVAVIKAIYSRNEQRQNAGKKNGAVDERFFKAAEDRLYAELAFALKKNKDDMSEYIKKTING